jgi:GWxTD domain-containing protein
MAFFTRFSGVLAASVLLAITAPAQTPLHDLFNKGKDEFKTGRYEKSLDTLKQLDELSRAPEWEGLRKKLAPMLSFYRAADFAALGKPDLATKDFEAYLEAFPGAHLDPGAYPKAVIKSFEKTKDSVEKRSGAPREDSSLAAAYESWKKTLPPEAASVIPREERWSQNALRFLMTKQERDQWEKLSTDVERAEFAAAFWSRRDPDPTTPDNEFKDEMERRLLFANEHFGQGEKRGSETDRGMVFLLLGPPTYVGQIPLTSDDDLLQVQRSAPLETQTRDARGRIQTTYESRDPLTAERIQGTKEVWHYRRDTLHKAVGFSDLDIQFITRKGYGEGVMERDQNTLAALGEVARAYLPKK